MKYRRSAREGERNFFFHQQDRMPLLFRRPQDVFQVGYDDGHQPCGGSSRRRNIRLGNSALPMARDCCFPPLRVPPSGSNLSFNTGKRLKTFSRTISFSFFLIPVLRFSRTVILEKRPFPEGRSHPLSRHFERGKEVTSTFLKWILPALGLTMPGQGLQVVVLPAPFRPRRRRFPFLHFQGDA